MSLIYCPECGSEISNNAVACPNCGRPTSASVPVVEKKVVAVPPLRRESGFPAWAFIPIGIMALLVLFLAFWAFSRNDDMTEANVNVNMASRRGATEPIRETHVPSTDTQSVTIPPSGQTVTLPPAGTTVTLPPGQTTTVPGTTTAAPVAPPPDKGTVVINARVAPPRGSPQTVRNAKFYLLDQDVEMILSEARIEPIEGNTLTGSLGLAIVYPDRYGDFWRSAMRAIAAHSKYSGTTDSGGSANLANIMPKEYYLFGITKVGRGFAMWNAPVSVIAGQNNLNLSPQSVTEIPDTSG